MAWWKRIFSSSDRYIDNWVRGIGDALMTSTGLRITTKDALMLPGIAACVNVLSDDLAKVPLDIMTRTSDGGLKPATDHPLYNLFKFGPAPWLSSYAWRKALAHSVLVHGNGFSRVVRTNGFTVDRIVPVPATSICVRWTGEGEPFFDLAQTQGGVTNGLTWNDIVHVPYRASTDNGCDGGIMGVSPISQNREAIAVAVACERFAAKFFANGARPSMIIEMDRKLPNDEVGQRIRASIERIYSGVDQAFKVAILELGMKMREFSANPEDSQLLETRKEQAVQQCTMYLVPPHKIGILDRATFSNIEQQGIDYVTGPVSTLAKAIESALEIACLMPEERPLFKITHNLDALMRGDILSRYRAWAIGRQWGWLSADDVREFENLNKLPGNEGDKYLTPLNMVPADDTSTNPEDENEERPQRPSGARLKANGHLVNGAGKLLLSDGSPWRH